MILLLIISPGRIFLFVNEKILCRQSAHSTGFDNGTFTGIELYLDSIESLLSSASNPSGLTTLHAREFVTIVAQDTRPAYLHICEGTTQLADGKKNESTGKLVSYLVSDFIKESSRP